MLLFLPTFAPKTYVTQTPQTQLFQIFVILRLSACTQKSYRVFPLIDGMVEKVHSLAPYLGTTLSSCGEKVGAISNPPAQYIAQIVTNIFF